MDKKKKMAGKMESKTYTNTRCGHCGKFGHGHETHSPLERAIKSRKDSIKKIQGGDLTEMLRYAQMRNQQKGREY